MKLPLQVLHLFGDFFQLFFCYGPRLGDLPGRAFGSSDNRTHLCSGTFQRDFSSHWNLLGICRCEVRGQYTAIRSAILTNLPGAT